MGLLANLISNGKVNQAKRLALPFLRSILHLNRNFSKIETIHHCHQFSNALVFLENCFLQLSLRESLIEQKILDSIEGQITQLKSGLLLKSHEIVMIEKDSQENLAPQNFQIPRVVLKGILFYLLTEKDWKNHQDFSKYYLENILDEVSLLNKKELQNLSLRMNSFTKDQLELFLQVCLKSNFIPKLNYSNLFRSNSEEFSINALKFCFLSIQQPIEVLDKLVKAISERVLMRPHYKYLNSCQMHLLSKKLFVSNQLVLRVAAVDLAIHSRDIKSYSLLKSHLKDPSKQVRDACLNGLKKNFQTNLLLDESFEGKVVLQTSNFEEFASNLSMQEEKDLIFQHLKSRRDITRNKKSLLELGVTLLAKKKLA
ncbi:hypothetical protein MJH12_08140 [bacterium]|nr:hypothetical protein [bacterium]